MDYEKLRGLLPKTHTKWTSEDISVWLQFIGLQALYPSFKQAAIDGSCLASLTEEDLREELGIKSGITIKKLATWIKVGIKEFDEFLLGQPGLAGTLQPLAAQSTLANKSVFKSMVPAIENNKSKKLLNKYSRNEEPMEVEPVLEKLEEKAVAPGQTNPPARQLNELLIQQSDGVSSFYCLKEEGAKIGRHSSNKILILEESVSRYHAEIEYEDGQFFIRDIGSTTGTFIKIIDKIELEEGMIIEMGSNQFEVGRIKEGEVILRIIEGPNADTAEIPLVLKKGVKVNCGRKPTNQINFQDDQHLSNIHASFYNIENHYYLEDLATTNGTWLRLSEESTQSERYPLRDKTVFKIGTTYTYTCTRNGSAVVEEKNTQNLCVICCDFEKDCVYVPCNHNAACIRCSKGLKECPICRKRIEDFLKIYRM